ncbi:MAG: hypothetical protein KatS3mg131_1132 [Candidatus Tectimicrobiota bacterium]|nr:MAG: hypothetical protein KatS3mg131_1132 [Candidatus Tectomicrobia bacterium]
MLARAGEGALTLPRRLPFRRAAAALGLGLLLWLSAGRAGGQVLTLTPSLAVSEGYDDNLFQTHRDREADFVTLLTPALALRYAPSPTTSLDLDYRTRFAFFARHTEQNQVSQRAALRLATPLLALLRVNLSDTFELTEEPLERELTIEEVTGLRPVSTQRRRRTLRNRADLALDVRLLPRIALNPFFESLIVDVDVPDEVDEVRYRLGGDLGYITHVARDSRLSVVYDVTLHFFTTNPGGAARSDFAVHTLAARFRHALSPTLTSDVSVGYARTTSDDAALDGERQPGGQCAPGQDAARRPAGPGLPAPPHFRRRRRGGGGGRRAHAQRFRAPHAAYYGAPGG